VTTQNDGFHLFLSPHFDDAVLSCGGMIADLVQGGQTVVVYTAMAGKPSHPLPESPILQDLHTRWQLHGNPITERRREDRRALGALGALARHGTLLDCVYRVTYTPDGRPQALYPDEDALWGAIHPADTAPMLLEATPLPYPRTTTLHVPLGAGGHVDHRLVRDWGRQLARQYTGIAVRFYEEFPYNTMPDAVDAARATFAPQALRPALHTLNEAALQAKIEAIACYESQISTFWPDLDAMAAAVRAMAVQTGGAQPAEREWTTAAVTESDAPTNSGEPHA
jgi:LmbE family N-acetylglucosaminyl deacetylase